MIKILTRLLLLIPLLSLVSCGDDEPTNDTKYGGTLTALVNGGIISVSDLSFYIYQGRFELKSRGSNPFNFWTENGIAETSYDVLRGSGAFLTYTDEKKFYGLFGSNKQGELVITEIDEVNMTMSGTFQATLYSSAELTDKVTVSNGVFEDVPYVIKKESSGDTYLAKVDGVELKGTLGDHRGGSSFIVEYDNLYKNIILTFPSTTAPITYDVATFDDPYFGIRYVDGIYLYKATSGTITITSINTVNRIIEGTYSGLAESTPVPGVTKQITEGVFSFSY